MALIPNAAIATGVAFPERTGASAELLSGFFRFVGDSSNSCPSYKDTYGVERFAAAEVEEAKPEMCSDAATRGPRVSVLSRYRSTTLDLSWRDLAVVDSLTVCHNSVCPSLSLLWRGVAGFTHGWVADSWASWCRGREHGVGYCGETSQPLAWMTVPVLA